jgi:hypothetical protein
MKTAVASLYAYIIRFLIRAAEWLGEGSLRHALHSITQPVALRYADILKAIQQNTKIVQDLATVSCQIEQRDMHHKILDLAAKFKNAHAENLHGQRQLVDQVSALSVMVRKLDEKMSSYHLVTQSAWRNVDPRLTDVQMSQALQRLSANCLINPTSILSRHMDLSKRPKSNNKARGLFSRDYKALHRWNQSNTSCTTLVKVTFRQQKSIRDFCAAAISQLLQSDIPVLYALGGSGRLYVKEEVLKSFSVQAISQAHQHRNTMDTSFIDQTLLDAVARGEYTTVVGEVLQNFPLAYIFIDANAMDAESASQCLLVFRHLKEDLAIRGSPTVLRILITSHGPVAVSGQMHEDTCIRTSGAARGRNSGALLSKRRMAQRPVNLAFQHRMSTSKETATTTGTCAGEIDIGRQSYGGTRVQVGRGGDRRQNVHRDQSSS